MDLNCMFSENKNDFNINDCCDDLESIMKDQQKLFALVPINRLKVLESIISNLFLNPFYCIS